MVTGWLLATASTARADPPAAPVPPQAPTPVCLFGRALPHCTSVFLFELGLRYGRSSEGSDGSFALPASIGVLVNHGSSAWGGTFGLFVVPHIRSDPEAPEDDSIADVIAGSLRYRRWLGTSVGLDVGLGAGRFGGVLELGLEFGDLIAITAGVNTLQVDDGFGVAGNVGVRLGGALVDAIIRD